MTLKEYIKSLVREMLDEEGSTSGGAGPYSTPYAFKGKKKTKIYKEEEMPYNPDEEKDDVFPDGSSDWRKKPIKKESNYDKASPSQNPSPYNKASGYTGVGKDNHVSQYYDKRMKESLQDIIKKELLNEVTYKQFKSEVKYRTKAEQLHKAMREVKKKLNEIDRIVDYTNRMKQELSEGEEGLKYWGRTEKAIAHISETMNHLSNKIKNLHQ